MNFNDLLEDRDMKLSIYFLLAMLTACSTTSMKSEEMSQWLVHDNGSLKVNVPENWHKNEGSRYLSISGPNGEAITINGYSKPGAKLIDFSQYRFSSVANSYMPKGEMIKIESGYVKKFVGKIDGNSVFLAGAVKKGSAFFSLSIVTDSVTYTKNKEVYIKIFESVM
jgi:hypothetical protein